MLVMGLWLPLGIWLWQGDSWLSGASSLGCFYTLFFLLAAIARGLGIQSIEELTDLTHRPGPFTAPPAPWLVNRTYHWRHHFDSQTAYYSGTLTVMDKLLGTALAIKGKKIAVTGASGSLGKALLQELHQQGAKVTALTSGDRPIEILANGEWVAVPTRQWAVGQEEALADVLDTIDILIINHGLNVHEKRDSMAIAQSYEVNAFSGWRLLEAFLQTVKTNKDIATKEVWVNTSEAESNPAFSPLYELSKRTLGDLVTLRRLDAPCVIRKLILGPFKSNLNPIGILKPPYVAKEIVNAARRDRRNIIVTINPLTWLTFPLKEFFVSTYFKLFTRN